MKKEETKVNKRVKNVIKSKSKKKNLKRSVKEEISDKDSSKKVSDDKKVVYARSLYIKGSAQKARLVVDIVRGMNVLDAINKLKFVEKRASLYVRKTIESAIANAVNNYEMDKKRLFIYEIFVNDAPMLKRGRAGSRGRYNKILKRNCHIIVGLKER